MLTKFKGNIFAKKNLSEKTLKVISLMFTSLIIVLLLSMLGFIIWKSTLAFSHYGIENILFTDKFDFNGEQNSFWLPFSITLLTTFIATLIAAPIGIKTAIFIKFRVKHKYKKMFRLIFETLAGIPSVIFGLFASKALGEFTKLVFNVDSSYSIINASIMLAFMIIPTIIAMSLNSLEAVDKNLLTNPIAIGSSKTRAIYKVYKKAASNGIIVGVILAIGRAIGEAMALSMILQNQNYSELNNGLGSVLFSDLKTLSTIISYNMFADSTSEAQKSLLFAFGLFLFIFVGIINVLIIQVTKKKTASSKTNKFSIYINRFFNNFKYLFGKIFFFWEYITFTKWSKLKVNDIPSAINYSKVRLEKHRFQNLYSWNKIFWEYLSILICFSFLSWLLMDIFINGGISLTSQFQSVFSYTRDTTGQSFFNTILIIFVAIGISLPLSLIISIYLNEFLKSPRFKRVINFFLDALGSTPSILFGLFGLTLFIQVLGWTANGVKGNSLIAGALTISIVILPSFIRAINHALSNVPLDIKKGAYALGSNKFEVISKIVLPCALIGIITSVVLSIGRIFSESAPLYLTAGLSSSSFSVLDRPGQTLTTRIFNQLTNTNGDEAHSIMYECAFVLIFLILFLVIIAYFVIPNSKKIKKYIKNEFIFLKFKMKNKMKLGEK
ncbi:MAG: phosphate ABC transporter permease PstA [Malacoplasma sp.]